MILGSLLLPGLLCGALAGPTADPGVRCTDNWPHWRGPNANGIAERGDPPVSWSQTENLKWKIPVPGSGTSTPIVWGNQIFVLSAVETDRTAEQPTTRSAPPTGVDQFPGFKLPGQPTKIHQFLVMSFDRETGALLWRSVATEKLPHRGHHRHHGYASGSPVTDGRHLYASFGSRGVFCYDLEGSLRWSRDLGEMEKYLDFGEAVTPVVHGGTVIVVHDHLGQSFIEALDAETGKTRWKVDRDAADGWATPLLLPHGDTQQVITSGRTVRSYDIEDGRIIWHCRGIPGGVIPTPVEFDGRAIFASGYPKRLMIAVPVDGEGDMSDRISWKLEKGLPYVPTPLICQDTLFFLKNMTTVMTGIDARNGEVTFPARRLNDLTSNLYASPVASHGRMYFTDRSGTTLVMQKNGDKLETLAVNRLDDPIDASAAITGNKLILRSHSHLYCFERGQ